jgi:hypothetical protein
VVHEDDDRDMTEETEEVERLCITENDIQHALRNPFGPEEQLFAEVGMNIAADVGVFDEKDELSRTEVNRKPVAIKATITDIYRYRQWEAIINKIAKKDNEGTVLDRSHEIWPSTGSRSTERGTRSHANGGRGHGGSNIPKSIIQRTTDGP